MTGRDCRLLDDAHFPLMMPNSLVEGGKSRALQFRASTGKREAAQVFDYGNNVELPTVKVLPGNELTWRAAFGVDEGEPFVLTVDYAFGNETGFYQ